jgi:hypothetical protein
VQQFYKCRIWKRLHSLHGCLEARIGGYANAGGGVITHVSRKLKKHEELYDTHDLELVVVMLALKLWRHYLVGRGFELKTNHERLKHLFTQRDLNA